MQAQHDAQVLIQEMYITKNGGIKSKIVRSSKSPKDRKPSTAHDLLLLLLCQSFADVLSSRSKAQPAANSVEFFDLL